MVVYCWKRILAAIPVLLGISLLAFILGVLSPGDPAEFVLNQNGLDVPSEAQILAMRAELGLDRPFLEQYLSWLGQVLQGNLGSSYITGRNIANEIALRLPLTVKLALLSMATACFFGIVAGVLSAYNQGKSLDKFLMGMTNVMLSVPSFWLALLMILVFSENLRLLPTSGSESFKNFLMPAFVLSFSTMGTVCRLMRGLMVGEFGKQYFSVAKARGLSSLKLLFVYAFPNAVLPVIALLGNYFAGVLGGSVIVESIFAMPGMGTMALEAIRFRDYPVLQGYVLVSGWLLVLVTLGVDLLIALLNPRVQLGVKK